MDPRRFVILACAGFALSGCATLRELVGAGPMPATAAASPISAVPANAAVAARPTFAAMASIPNPPVRGPTRAALASPQRAAPRPPASRLTLAVVGVAAPAAAYAPAPAHRPSRPPAATGQTAIAAANARAREASRSEAFVGGVQVFTYDAGRVYEVWTAPLRVTTLTLAPGETIVSKAAGDTVRWQIGETTSGQGPAQRAHVMIKPLARGLETNLVLATSQRVYLLQLQSGPPETFNASVTWDVGAVLAPAAAALGGDAAATAPDPLVTPAGPLDARFKIQPRGRRPAWTPTAVMTDGVHTFLSFPPELAAQEAPALFVVGPGGEAQLVNYRQQDGLWVVDRVFDEAELRVGDKHPQVVRIVRTGGRS